MTRNDLKCFSALMVLVMGLALVLPGGPVFALDRQPLAPGNYFGPVTLTTGKSVRINIANLGSFSSVAPFYPCTVLVMFVDQNGRILNGNGRGQTFTIEPGKAASVRYSPTTRTATTEAGGAKAEAILVRGVVLCLTSLLWVIQSSMEVLDSTGHTIQILHPFERSFLNPQPLPPR